MKALASLAESGDARTLATIAACLEDVYPRVREQALAALARVAKRGDSQARRSNLPSPKSLNTLMF